MARKTNRKYKAFRILQVKSETLSSMYKEIYLYETLYMDSSAITMSRRYWKCFAICRYEEFTQDKSWTPGEIPPWKWR